MKNWNSIVLTVAVTIAASGSSGAQTYSVVPNDTIFMTGVMEDLATLSIQQINISANTITLGWQKVSENIPLNWETNVCDNVLCYASLINSGTMNPIIPGDYGFLMMHVTPHVNYGTATIRYEVWDVAYPILRDTLTYILTVNSPTGINEGLELDQVFLSSPPASGFISIHNKTFLSLDYSICDISGKLIDKGISSAGLINITTDFYRNGLYCLTIMNDSGERKAFKFIIHK
jgi:hypothetical protein